MYASANAHLLLCLWVCHSCWVEPASFFIFCMAYPSLSLKSPLSSRFVSSGKPLVIHQADWDVSSWCPHCTLDISLSSHSSHCIVTVYYMPLSCLDCGKWLCPFPFYIQGPSRLPGTWQSVNVFLYGYQEGRKEQRGEIYRHRILMIHILLIKFN